jgi:hypothetical protein
MFPVSSASARRRSPDKPTEDGTIPIDASRRIVGLASLAIGRRQNRMFRGTATPSSRIAERNAAPEQRRRTTDSESTRSRSPPQQERFPLSRFSTIRRKRACSRFRGGDHLPAGFLRRSLEGITFHERGRRLLN